MKYIEDRYKPVFIVYYIWEVAGFAVTVNFIVDFFTHHYSKYLDVCLD